jgi:hypothetical protein
MRPLADASALPSPMLIIANCRCITFGGEARSGRLTLRIACEATVRPAFGIFETVMSRGNDGASVRRARRAESCNCQSDNRSAAIVEIIFISRSPLIWMPTLNIEIGDRESDYRKIHLG